MGNTGFLVVLEVGVGVFVSGCVSLFYFVVGNAGELLNFVVDVHFCFVFFFFSEVLINLFVSFFVCTFVPLSHQPVVSPGLAHTSEKVYQHLRTYIMIIVIIMIVFLEGLSM